MATKKSKPATVGDVQRIIDKSVFKMISEATDAILDGMQKMFDAQGKKIETNTTKVDEVKTELSFARDDIKGLEGELASTVSKSEFSALKGRVDKYHPVN
jgi:hypothetical protein